MRTRPHLCTLLLLLTLPCAAQAPDFATLVQQLPAQGTRPPAAFFQALDRAVRTEPLSALQRQIPPLLDLASSAGPPTRALALAALLALEDRKLPGSRSLDPAAPALLVPFLGRLTPLLHNSDPGTRNMAFVVLQGLARVRPTPPALLTVLLDELRRPDATTSMPAPPGAPGSPSKGPAPALGPEILFILLPADATFGRDPSTGITEGQNSPEVQAATIGFIRRKDQTPASLAETMRAISLAQPQNTAVNAALIPFLDSNDPTVTRALLTYMNRFTLSPETYATARAKVEQIAANPNTPPDERTLATGLLACWHNNRHEMCDPSLQR